MMYTIFSSQQKDSNFHLPLNSNKTPRSYVYKKNILFIWMMNKPMFIHHYYICITIFNWLIPYWWVLFIAIVKIKTSSNYNMCSFCSSLFVHVWRSNTAHCTANHSSSASPKPRWPFSQQQVTVYFCQFKWPEHRDAERNEEQSEESIKTNRRS